ncbi:hypothetical protein K7X08_000278 [Anisodus acutangulus]|uniref:BSD domain-containing protein n=1 Tax=Anisodus acutangulus TaxID=402998 RepID=A0A9Q1M423_9SOLA|nr:hypothetical protein K7X08_000278 [Anisodus acutangulus]
MDFWQKARSFAEAAAKRTQEFTKETANRSHELTIGSSKISDVVLEASKRSKEFAAEASKRSKEIAVEASKRSKEIAVEASKRADVIVSEASKRADQIKVDALKQIKFQIPSSSSAAPQTALDAPTPADLEKFGVTDDLREFVKGITINTFQDFPLEDDSVISDIPTVSNVRQDLTEFQEKHAKFVLSSVKEISKLRYELCPRIMRERKFWRIYFILVNSHVSPYEKKYMEDAEIKSVEKAQVESEKEVSLAGTTSKPVKTAMMGQMTGMISIMILTGYRLEALTIGSKCIAMAAFCSENLGMKSFWMRLFQLPVMQIGIDIGREKIGSREIVEMKKFMKSRREVRGAWEETEKWM